VNEGELDSFLVEITAGIFRTPAPQKHDGSLLLEAAGSHHTDWSQQVGQRHRER